MLAGVWSRVRPASSSGVGHHLRREAVARHGLSQATKAGAHTLGLALPSRSLTQAPATEDGEVIANPRNVLEDSTSDYVAVQDTLQPLPPTVLELVQTKLPQFLPKPDVHDTCVFEDAHEEEDYTTVLASDATKYKPSSVSDSLYYLVSSSKYDEAYHVLEEILASGIPVRRSLSYLSAASAALFPRPNSTIEEQTKKCLAWLSLLPNRTPTKRTHFGLLRKRLFLSSSSNASTAIAVSIALAKKGYAEAISAHAIPFILRHAPPEVGLDFLAQFEDANQQYCTHRYGSAGSTEVESFITKVRSAAVKTLVHSGNLEHAIRLLPDPGKPAHKLTTRAYDAVLRTLERGHPDAGDLRGTVELLRSQDSSCFRGALEQGPEDLHIKQVTELINPSSRSYIGSKASDRLRKILHALRQEKLPELSIITDLLHYNAKLDRAPIAPLIHQIAQDIHPSAASRFLLAEMLFHRQRQEYIPILQLFCKHFYYSQVPSALLQMYSPNYQVSNNPPTSAAEGTSTASYVYRPRLWPSHAHTDLVWQSLAHLTRSTEDLAKLYETFLKVVRSRGSQLDASPDSRNAHLPSPPSQTRLADTEAFTVFLDRLGVTVEKCSVIFNDMVQTGIIPSIHNFTQLAGAYAGNGRPAQALFILDMLEKQHPQVEPIAPRTRQEVEASLFDEGHSAETHAVPFTRDPKDKLPKPDLAFYTSIMSQFLKAKYISEAVEIDERVNARFIYKEGLHPPLDRVRLKLEHMRQKYQPQTQS